MDNYIEKYEKAKEIQKLWRPKIGDWFSDINYETGMIILFPITKKEKLQFIKDKFWLPTQEQLQEMILPALKIKYNKYWKLNKMKRIANWFFRIFNCFLNEHSNIYSNNMNELWLAFVMYEKYNKIWTGEKWVKAE